MHGGFRPKSSTLRLYTEQSEGGRGLVSVRATVQDETTKIQECINKMAPKDELLSDYLRQQKPTNADEEDEPSLRDKPLYGMYHHHIEEVADIKKSSQ